jgi:signal transduction histidine kinase
VKSESEQRIDLLNKLAESLIVNEPERASALADEALALSKKLHYGHGIGHSLGLKGYVQFMVSNFEAALPLLTEALLYAEEKKFDEGRAKILGGLAAISLSQGNYERALHYHVQALNLAVELSDTILEAWGHYNLGQVYHEIGDFRQALSHFERSKEQFETAVQSEKVHSKNGLARALTGIGTVNRSLGNIEQAFDAHNKSLLMFRESGNRIGESRALDDLGLIYQEKKESEKAFQYHNESLQIRETIGNKQAQSTSLINLGRLFIEKKEGATALDYLHRALALAEEIKAKPRIYQCHQALSAAYELQGDMPKALGHFKLFQQVKEEVSGDEANAKIKNMQVGFEVEKSKREAEIERLKNIELKEKNQQLQQLLDELQLTQNQLVQSEKLAALGGLVAGVAHELNSPLGAMKSTTDVIGRALQIIIDCLSASSSLEALRENKRFQRAMTVLSNNQSVNMAAVERVSRIVESLKSYAGLDEGEFRDLDINDSLDALLVLLEHDLGSRIKVIREFKELPMVSCYASEVNQVFMHLLSNATKAIRGNGDITLRTYKKEKMAVVEVCDTGVGISAEQRSNLFEPSFSSEGTRVKTGMGLFTSYNIVQKHQGVIEVESEVGAGSKFTVALPVIGTEPST